MTDLADASAPDDSGSDTYRRYRYQALLAFPFCLDCALGGDVVAVVPEHFEDLALEYPNGNWRLVQIKTRDPERGFWKLSDVLADDGGLRTLLRSYSAIPDASCMYELWLEGTIKPKDAIQGLMVDPHLDSALVERIRIRFDLDTKIVSEFLNRFRLLPNQPPRSTCAAQNIRHLGQLARNLPYGHIEAIHETIVHKIETAMAAELLGDEWPRTLLVPASASTDARLKIAQKRLTAEMLGPLASGVRGAPRTLLKRITNSGSTRPSLLEEKLLAGGASPGMVEAAKSLRAQASIRELEVESRSLWSSEEVIGDLRERLRHRIEAAKTRFGTEARPAVRMWEELTDVLARQASAIDPRMLFSQDSDLLLGEICQMADLCMIDWGVADA